MKRNLLTTSLLADIVADVRRALSAGQWPQRLLTTRNEKTEKGERYGWRTSVMHLAPASLSGFNVCRFASAGCRAACLNVSGRAAAIKATGAPRNRAMIQWARVAKTLAFFTDRERFMAQLVSEVSSAIRCAERRGMLPAFRLNATSDIPWHRVACGAHENIMARFPDIQFYDYTKAPGVTETLPLHYDLTWSFAETNSFADIEQTIANGRRVAAVFSEPPGAIWRGLPVVNGDDSDLRFLDPIAVVALKPKGLAKHDDSGFVIRPQGRP